MIELSSVDEAIARLRWHTLKPDLNGPGMPRHQYCVKRECEPVAYAVLQTIITKSPESYRAYWRGYQSAFRYWEHDGNLYWQTYLHGTEMLNRRPVADGDLPRRVSEGGKPIPPDEWGAKPFWPQGAGWGDQAAPSPKRARAAEPGSQLRFPGMEPA
jgi:hypothetical protein